MQSRSESQEQRRVGDYAGDNGDVTAGDQVPVEDTRSNSEVRTWLELHGFAAE
ncbi:MAG: hypothetical protein AAF961_17235 [Planctomycetota bacterium]